MNAVVLVFNLIGVFCLSKIQTFRPFFHNTDQLVRAPRQRPIWSINSVALCQLFSLRQDNKKQRFVQRRYVLISVLGVGFALGLRHALDADHLIAVTTIVGERKGILSSLFVGVFWGLGHTLSLLVVGLVVIGMNVRIPEQVAMGMEFGVAAMLVFLGFRVIVKLVGGGTLHAHVHTHGNYWHVHPHTHASDQVHGDKHADERHSHAGAMWSSTIQWLARTIPLRQGAGRSVLIGMVHGLAGSAALMLIVLTSMSSPAAGLAYLTAFGIGSVGGMALMSMLIGIPFVVTAQRSSTINIITRGVSGVLSVGFGLFLAYHIGFVDGLFL